LHDSAEGQREVLASYGITEEAVGAPVRCTMDVVELPCGEAPCRVFMDSFAAQACCSVFSQMKVNTDPWRFTSSANHSESPPGVLKRLNNTLAEELRAI